MKVHLRANACLIIVVLCLVILSQFGMMKYSANANPTLDINIEINKQLFNVGETVKVTGNITLDGILKNDSLAAVEIYRPDGKPFVIRTVKTGDVSGGYWRVQILDVYACDDLGNPKTIFNRGSQLRINFTMKNIDVVTHHVVAAVYMQCSDNTPLLRWLYHVYDADIEAGQTVERYPIFLIPTDAPLGEVRMFASLFSDNPQSIGTPYCPEKTATFYIQSTTPAMPQQPAYFNVTFVLPIKNCTRGAYIVYATTRHYVETSIEIEQFTVIGPVPVFTYSPANPIVCQIATFDGSASYDIGGTIAEWYWQFGDGTTASGAIVTHAYEVGGYQPVSLTVTDNDGGSNTTTKFVNILEAWPMFHHNPSRWGNSTSLSPVTNHTLWSLKIGPDASAESLMYSSAAVYPDSGGNVVFVSSTNGTVYALNANSGGVIWKTTPSVGYKCYSSPAIASGLVFVGSENGKIYALNATNGTVKYSITTGGSVHSSAAVLGDRVFIGSRDRKVYAFHTNGTILWMSDLLDEAIDSSSAVAGGKVFVATWNGSVYALNETTGVIKWKTAVTPGGRIYSSPVVLSNRVFIGSTDSHIYALDAETGVALWNFTTSNEVYSSPAVSHGVVFVGSMDGNLYAVNAITGSLVWNKTIGSIKWSSPSIVEGKVFVGTTDGKAYALRETNGEIWWSYQSSGAFDSSPSVLNDTLYVCSKSGNIFAFYSQTHDVATTSVVPLKSLVRKTEVAIINVVLWNKGSFSETANVTAFYGATFFYSILVGLSRGEERLLSIPWDTTNVPTGLYVMYVNTTLTSPTIDDDPSNNNKTCQIKVEFADIGIDNVTPSTPEVNTSITIPVKSIAGKDYGVTIYANVRNKSNFTETNLQITFYWSNSTHVNQTIGNAVIPQLPIGASVVANITWATSNVAYGNYTISAYAWSVVGETDLLDNVYSDGAVRVVVPGDVTSSTLNVPEGKVDMRDIGAVCNKFGTKPSSPSWDPNKDVNNDGRVDMRDIGIACQNYGVTET